MTLTVHGKVHGRTIQLNDDLGVPDGQDVEVQITIIERKKKLPGPPPGWRPGAASTSAGKLADLATPEEDAILEQIHSERKATSRN